ncbi:hypothetical protein M9Y10_016337 [Tritrichomonas musculus]|uniref:Protein kinase domain-containing protein n=1 Tax=Tritrichomonas musculus TaxID=1915356 RepID=A0ABR2GM77_9EUKA
MSKAYFDKYIFKIDDYKVIREIKRGGFGIVNLVQNNNTKEQFAAKTNLIETGITKRRQKQFISREIGILIQVQHPTIIRFKGFSFNDFQGYRNMTILMDYMKGGSLSDLIKLQSKSLAPGNYDNTKRQIILVGIARGMMLLHQRHVIHRDLKAENILLDEDFHPCITDFGLSKFFDPNHSMTQSLNDSGTAAYMAPEIINGDHFNTKADVYAFGILMNEVISGKLAYSDLLNSKKPISIFQLKVKVTNGLRPDIDDTMKKGFRVMIEKCLSKDPKERPSFSELYHKLSLSQDDYIFQFEENATEENKIFYEEDDDDDEKQDDDDSNIFGNQRYCLDDVDMGELFDYIDEISVDLMPNAAKKDADSSKDKEIEELKKHMKEKEKEQEIVQSEMKKKIRIMEKTIQEQADDNQRLKNEIDSLKNQIKEMGS